MDLPLIVPVGDPAGIGPRVAATVAAEMAGEARCILFGDRDQLLAEICVPVLAVDDPLERGVSIVDVGRVAAEVIDGHQPHEVSGRHQLAALEQAVDWMLEGRGRALVTGPVCKEAVVMSGTPFTGQTEHVAARAGARRDDVTMMFLGNRLKVALVTTHLGLRAVADAITQARVERSIGHLLDALSALGDGPACRDAVLRDAVPRDAVPPVVAVTGLNPHGSEFGSEEAEVIAPAIASVAARTGGRAELLGPIGAETAFRLAAAGQVDGVVAMYHDQATIASKLLDFGAAVNVTWGLPFLRTSVDHGVAFDAAARGEGDPDGMRSAMRLALSLTERGTSPERQTAPA